MAGNAVCSWLSTARPRCVLLRNLVFVAIRSGSKVEGQYFGICRIVSGASRRNVRFQRPLGLPEKLWRQSGRDIVFEGNTYYWSKHREYLKFIDLPKRVAQPLELATGLIQLSPEDSNMLKSNRWHLTDSHPLSVCSYRDYLQASRGEFTVAKDANVRLRTGWFSDRSACYLAAGRPVITQDTGFGTILPTGEGLFAFNTMDEILTAFEAIECDYERHSRAARDIAEDFGHISPVNRGVMHAHEHGIVTSASLMVRWPAAVEAAEYAKSRPGLVLGLHLDFGEWVYKDENWTPVYNVVPLDEVTALRNETSRQLAVFRILTGRDPSHIDSHQHAHLREPARSVVLEAALEVRAPVRDCSPEIHYCGRFYVQTAEGSPHPEGITSGALLAILSQLPPGVTELACHPGEGWVPNTTYIKERATELKTLCDLKVRSALMEMGIELCGFTSFLGLLASTEIGSPTR